MKRIIGALALAALAASTALAADGKEGSSPTYLLPENVVTETKVSQPLEKVTQQIDVLYADDMNRQTTYNRNIAELLRYTPGLFVDVLSRNDANWGSFGGLGPKYNVYLLDGLPIDSFADSMSLDPWAFDRVELHKGPASVMYSNYLTMDFAGNEAPLAGITNFIMKDTIDAQATRILLGGGSWGTVNGRFYHQNRMGNLNYFVGVNYEQSDYANYGTPDSWLHILQDPDYRKTRLYGKMTYLFGRDDHKLSLFAHHTQHSGEVGRPNRDYDHSYDTVNAAYTNQITGALNLQVKTGYRNYDRRWAEDNFPTDLALREHDGVKQHIFPSDVTLNYRHFGDSMLTFGADSQVATYKTYAEPDGVRTYGNDMTAWSTGVYLQEKVVIDKWVLRAGGRFNYTHHSYDLIGGGAPGIADKSWDKLLWSAGVRYNATPRIAFFGNAGSSFVAPSGKSVGGTLQASDAGVSGRNGQLPNPDLKPESGIGTDLGIEITPLDTMKVKIRGFYNKVDDAIVENVVSSDPSQSKSVNAGKAESIGVEVAVEHAVADYLQWFANLTYTGTTIKNPYDADQDDSDISFVPDYVANVGITVKLPLDFSISPYLQIVGTYYDSTSKSGRSKFGPYQVLNIKIQKPLFTSSGYTLNAALDLNNVTNERYSMPWQFRDPGFNAFGSVELTF